MIIPIINDVEETIGNNESGKDDEY